MSSYKYEVIKTEPDIPIKCFSYRNVILPIPAHWHNSLEIIRVEHGNMDVVIGDTRYKLTKHNYVIINSREIHSTFSEIDTIVEVLQIPFSFLKRYIPDMERYQFVSFVDETQTNSDSDSENNPHMNAKKLAGLCIHRMIQLEKEKKEDYIVEFHSYLFQLFHLLYQNFRIPTDEKALSQNDSNRKRITSIMDYVNTHYKEHITLEEAAELVMLNKEYFCRFFKRYMGMSFIEYVNEVRFSHVCEDILASDRNIMHLLEEHGFTNYKLFIRMYRKQYHCTPSDMRKRIASNKTKK